MSLYRDDLKSIAVFVACVFILLLGVGACVHELFERAECEKAGGVYLSQRGAPGLCVDLKKVPT